MTYQWPDFIGNVGVFFVLLSYMLLQLERMDSKSFSYSLLNFSGAILILVSLVYNFNLSSFIIEIFWLLISAYGLLKARRSPST